jgi:hypothetical protein
MTASSRCSVATDYESGQDTHAPHFPDTGIHIDRQPAHRAGRNIIDYSMKPPPWQALFLPVQHFHGGR